MTQIQKSKKLELIKEIENYIFQIILEKL